MNGSQRIRLYLLALVIIGGFLLLVHRLWDLQIDRQEEFTSRLPVTGKVYRRVPGPRGEIRDRNGIPLARNISRLEVALNLADVENYWRAGNPKAEVPKFEWDPRRDPETDIIKILNETLFPKLNALGLYEKPSPKMVDALRVWYRTNRGIIPFPYSKPLERERPEEFEVFAAFAEYAYQLPGVTLRDRPTRVYPLKALGAHLLGYVRQAGKERPPEDDTPAGPGTKWDYFENDDFGIAGLEKTLDKDLRGHPGQRVFLKNEHGRVADEIVEERRDPAPGDDIYLTLDAGVQSICEEALREALIEGSNVKGVGRGAVTVIDPNTGEILAMAAVPSYDPNQFIPAIGEEAWKELNEDPLVPLLSRMFSAYEPGSTFKIVTGLAASMSGVGGKSYNCSGSVYYGRAFKCWTVQKSMPPHGTIGLTEAIKRSCNCYFYQSGNQAGIDNIEKVGKLFGLGEPLSVELEYPVIDRMPGREWWARQNKGPWTSAKTANVSIGQGEVLVTPLHMALVAGAVAVGGKSYYPTLVHHHVKYSRNKAGDIVKMTSSFTPRLKFDLVKEGVKEKDIEAIRLGMWKVVNDQGGTARAARSPLGIAGKTGTAQAWRVDPKTKQRIKDNITSFVAFAPYDNPKVAVCVMVANGNSGGGVAAPVAKRVIERTLGMASGNWKQEIKPLEPAKGHFEYIHAIKYEGEDLPAPKPGEEPDSSDTGEESEDGGRVMTPEKIPASATPQLEEDVRVRPKKESIRKRKFKQQGESSGSRGGRN